MPRRSLPQILQLKHDLAAPIVRLLAGWDQACAAKLIRDEQPRVSELRRGQLHRLSVMRLMTFVTQLGHDVEIRLTPTSWHFGEPKPVGRFRVVDDACDPRPTLLD